MSPAKAILLGSVVVGASIVAHLGYTVFHDRAVAESARQAAEATKREKEAQARAEAQAYRDIQSKEAWKKSLRFFDVHFKQWLGSQLKMGKNQFITLDMLWVKEFDFADVRWDDRRHVTVRSIVGSEPRGGRKVDLFLWTNKIELVGDGVDYEWRASDPVFQPINLPKEKEDQLKVQVLSGGGWESPMIR